MLPAMGNLAPSAAISPLAPPPRPSPIFLEENGSAYGAKWAKYVIRIEALPVKTYATAAERRRDASFVYGGALWPNPGNKLQLLRPVTWCVHRAGSRAYVRLSHSGVATIENAHFLKTATEAGQIWAGLALVRRVAERRGKASAFEDAESLIKAVVQAYRRACADGDVRYSQELIAAELGLSARYIFRVLAPKLGLSSAALAHAARKC
jgi:hypothetical protein